MASACSIRVRGVGAGVGFRPYVSAVRANTLAGWVLNGEEELRFFFEGEKLQVFVQKLKSQPPPAADIADIRDPEPRIHL